MMGSAVVTESSFMVVLPSLGGGGVAALAAPSFLFDIVEPPDRPTSVTFGAADWDR
jgi:hypothetical protein